MKFELNNEQRKYLGLEIVPENWSKLQITEQVFIYFDGNTIKKKISVTDNLYREIQLNEDTENRTMLLPKTNRGKAKKLNYSSLDSRNGIGVYFNFDVSGITIGNYTTEQTYYSTFFENIKFNSIDDLPIWLESFISKTTQQDLKDLEEFATKKRKRIKLKEGDFFTFKVDRRNYGFGRLIADVRKIRKEPSFKEKKNYGLAQLMTQPLVIKVYHIIENSKKIELEKLKALKGLPSQYIMDNALFYGDYEVIGNLPLEGWEIEFPISYARSISHIDIKTVYLQYGRIYKEIHRDKFYKYIEIPNPESKNDWDSLKFNPHRNESIGAGLNFNKSTLEKVIAKNSNEPYWNDKIYQRKDDLRNPENKLIKKEIFEFFGLNSEKSYFENIAKENVS
ncbi:immunity 26/phosphotriesterase HocA family protein [uncultured Aquimarina sp.]|uniref:immunity 26/phosphotriesterase HocA family protein n=1 Tax=uncultured Aquimarina sp. TaxID=575652 RepID=UPI00261448BA|nr:immunity 26/phosphotriesterase HocA family protein [uncultured Aquimarina sp.]